MYESIEDTGFTHDIEPNYGFFLQYNQASSVDYVTLDNGDKEPIECCGKTLVKLGVEVT